MTIETNEEAEATLHTETTARKASTPQKPARELNWRKPHEYNDSFKESREGSRPPNDTSAPPTASPSSPDVQQTSSPSPPHIQQISSTSPPHVQQTSSPSPPHVQQTSSPSPPHVQQTSSTSPPHVQQTSSLSPPHVQQTSSPSPPHAQQTSSPSPPHVQQTSSTSPPHVQQTSSPSPSHVQQTSPPSPQHVQQTSSPSPPHVQQTSSPSPPHAQLTIPPPLPPKQAQLAILPPKQAQPTLPPPLPPKQAQLSCPPPLPPKQAQLSIPPPLPPKQAQLTKKAKKNFEEQNLWRRENVLPRNWIPIPRDDKGNDVTVHLVELSISSAEYQDVENKFHKTINLEKIKSIERIQNPYLYQAYQLRKLKMDRDSPHENNERQLFHGTNSANITKINTQGFDRSFTGSVHGALYGAGVYFARDASYSMGFTGGSRRVMYLARVLVGRYCKGRSSMKKPPSVNSEQPEILFDSMVDDMKIPSIFVTYYDNQCYPEYLITF